MRKVGFFFCLVLVGFLLWRLGLELTALVVIVVAVPAVVAATAYPNWQETGAPARELLAFWLAASFLGVLPVFIKVFLMLRSGSLLAVGELLGGLAGLAYFLVTLLASVGQPLRAYFPEVPRTLARRPGSEALMAAVEDVARRARASLRAVYTVPAEVLSGGPVEFAGVGTANLYLSEDAVQRLAPDEVAFLVGTELWYVRHRDLWWNLAVYYTWLVFVGLHDLWGWVVVAVVGGVMFSVLWPLASRLKQLAADRYAARLTGNTEAALTALTALPRLTPGLPPEPRGWRDLWRALFSYEVPVGVRVRSLSLVLAKGSSGERGAGLGPWPREGLRFSLLQVLLLLGVAGLVALPLYLEGRGFLDQVAVQISYLVIAVVLYAPFTLYTLRIVYHTFLAPGEGAPPRRLPVWAVAVPLGVFAVAVTVTWGFDLSPKLVEVAMAVSAGFLLAGLVAGEIEALRRGGGYTGERPPA